MALAAVWVAVWAAAEVVAVAVVVVVVAVAILAVCNRPNLIFTFRKYR